MVPADGIGVVLGGVVGVGGLLVAGALGVAVCVAGGGFGVSALPLPAVSDTTRAVTETARAMMAMAMQARSIRVWDMDLPSRGSARAFPRLYRGVHES